MTLEDKIRLIFNNNFTLSMYLHILNKFKLVVGEKDEYDSWDAAKFIDEYRKQTKGKAVVTAYNVLKRIFDIAEWEWDESIVKKPNVDELSVNRILLDEGLIDRMIENHHKLDSYRKGLLFLSTIYGLRRIELAHIRKEDIDLDSDPMKILIRTAKGGEKRWQMLPEIAYDILLDFTPKDISVVRLSYIFHTILYLTTEEIITEKCGWHAIRREVAIKLSPPYTTLTDYEIYVFMRWATSYGSSSKTLYEYRKAAKESSLFEIDAKVLSQHYFLRKWEEFLV